MNSSRPDRKPRTPSLKAEALETRQMLTGGVGSTFAILPATISKAGGQVSVSFTLNPTLFTSPGNKPFILGLDVAPGTGSKINPSIKSVTTPTGQTLNVTHAAFDQSVKRTGVQGSTTQSSAALVTIPGLQAKTAKSFTYKVNVTGLQQTSGSILVGFYLPGDADGNGTVNQSDLNAIRYGLNTSASDTTGKYSFDADSNRTGMINNQDLAIATKNLGVSTTVSPVISANVTPSQMVDPKARITNSNKVTITGTATPGATITYSETGIVPLNIVADKTGAYTADLPLLTGINSYNVATSDAFNQKISGSINTITYTPPASAPRFDRHDGSRDGDYRDRLGHCGLDHQVSFERSGPRVSPTSAGISGSSGVKLSASIRLMARLSVASLVPSSLANAWRSIGKADLAFILPRAQADAPRMIGSGSSNRSMRTGIAS